jgi:hypothetical protein
MKKPGSLTLLVLISPPQAEPEQRSGSIRRIFLFFSRGFQPAAVAGFPETL